ncbi:Transcription factor asqA [Fusarium oxysporum f. sp. albedinis]|nr:Transcription factor asqA [Fusarium oxysporum f. sp. albedinis]
MLTFGLIAKSNGFTAISHGSRCTKVNVNVSDPPEQGDYFLRRRLLEQLSQVIPPWSPLVIAPGVSVLSPFVAGSISRE